MAAQRKLTAERPGSLVHLPRTTPAVEELNDPRLSDEEKSLIHRWVAAGAPEGDKKDLPPPKQFAEGWQIGKPDVVTPRYACAPSRHASARQRALRPVTSIVER